MDLILIDHDIEVSFRNFLLDDVEDYLREVPNTVYPLGFLGIDNVVIDLYFDREEVPLNLIW